MNINKKSITKFRILGLLQIVTVVVFWHLINNLFVYGEYMTWSGIILSITGKDFLVAQITGSFLVYHIYLILIITGITGVLLILNKTRYLPKILNKTKWMPKILKLNIILLIFYIIFFSVYVIPVLVLQIVISKILKKKQLDETQNE